MTRKLKYGLSVYLVGAVATGALLAWDAVEKGGLERLVTYGPGYIAFLVAMYAMVSALWPVLAVALAVHYGSIPFDRSTCAMQQKCGAVVSPTPVGSDAAPRRH